MAKSKRPDERADRQPEMDEREEPRSSRQQEQTPSEPAAEPQDGREGVLPERQRRQSAPRPTAEEAAMRMREQSGAQPGGMAQPAMQPMMQPIGREQVREAVQTLNRYKQGKANLETRIVENEEWYKLRNWECMRRERGGEKAQVEPVSGWLFNSIANKLADFMDSFPSANILPREEADKGEAKALTSIIPVVLEQADFEQVYFDVSEYKLKAGTGVYGVFWDASRHNGLGDISLKRIDLLNLFWEPGITDIQDSPELFYLTLEENKALEAQYPELRGRLSSQTIDIRRYLYDDTVDTTTKSVVVDWYYKRRTEGGRTILHYCKFCNDTVLFATENTPEYAERGIYDHGEYPFVFDSLYSMEGTPCGFGYIDIGKSAQEYIDRCDAAVLQNLLFNAKPRHFIRSDGSVNEREYADATKDFVHVDGNLGGDSVLPIQTNPLPAIYAQIVQNKIAELKETTGNRDVSTGGTTSGVTAASAIAAMQEASGKLSRNHNKSAYRSYRKVVYMVIELIRQFYELPRWFRILGERGSMEFVQYSNAGLRPQEQGGMEFGVDTGFRLPEFDIEVTAEKANPYSRMEQNELALSFYSAGFFAPQMADQALSCLEMMDFDRKQELMDRIQQNGTLLQMVQAMQQQMLQMAQIIDADRGTNMAEMIAQGVMAQDGNGMEQPPQIDAAAASSKTAGMSGAQKAANTRMEKARQEQAARTEVR